MIVDTGEKVHIIERRYFPEDLRRHLIGVVTRCTENVIRVKGRVWVFDGAKGQFVRKPEERDRVVPLCNRLNINVIPPEVILDEIAYVITPQNGLVVTDGKKFSLDVTEFTATR